MERCKKETTGRMSSKWLTKTVEPSGWRITGQIWRHRRPDTLAVNQAGCLLINLTKLIAVLPDTIYLPLIPKRCRNEWSQLCRLWVKSQEMTTWCLSWQIFTLVYSKPRLHKCCPCSYPKPEVISTSHCTRGFKIMSSSTWRAHWQECNKQK